MNLSNSEKSFNSSSHTSNSSSFKNKILPDHNNNNNTTSYNQQQVMQGSNTKLSKNGSFGSSTNIYQQQQHQQQRQELLKNKSKSFNYGEYMSTQKQNYNPLQRNVPVLQTTQNSKLNNNPSFNQQPWRQQPQQFQQHQQTSYPHIQQQQQTAYSNNQQQNINYNQSISHQKSSQKLQQQKQVTNPLMRSQTNVNRNMQKHEITIDLNDFNVKANSSNLLTTYQQQQQYNKSLSMSSNYKSMIFYGPRQQQSLVYIGQNPVLKNYFRLRRLKHEELILKRNEDGTIGLNDNNNANMTADGFVKVNVTGNRRLDNPEEYASINKERKETDVKNNERNIDDKKNKNKNNINKGNGNEKSSGGLKKMFKLFKNNSNEQKKNEIKHIKTTTTTVNTTNTVYTTRSSGQRPATLSNAPPLVVNLPTSKKEISPNFQNSPSKSPSPPKAYYMNPNFHHQQLQYRNSLHNSAVSNTSDKGLDLLLDTVLKSYDNSSDTDTDTLQYSSPVSFSPPALTARINAFAALNEGNNNNGNGIYMNRRDSVNSLASNNSSSKNSIRSLSYTNLQRLKLFQNEGEGEKDEILERLFDAFKEVKIFDEPRKKWIVYKGIKTREGRANLANRIDNDDHRKILSFSKSVEVFQLPEDRSDSSIEFLRANNSGDGDDEEEEEENEEFLKSLTEEELLKLKSMKELEMFQEIKKEINDYKSFEMLVHKDSILNTHFFM